MLTFGIWVLDILGIIGISLLCLLGLFLFFVLLVLFWPVTYRMGGYKDLERTEAWVKLRWFLGLLRADYRYPEPNRLKVKLLFFVLYDSKAEKKRSKKNKDRKAGDQMDGDETIRPPSVEGRNENEKSVGEKAEDKQAGEEQEEKKPIGNQTNRGHTEGEYTAEKQTEDQDKNNKEEEKNISHGKFSKIKYTILRFYDRIKNILENIEYYWNLLALEETMDLYLHAKKRIVNVLKNIRPRKIKAEIQFGTGSPDTTGYVTGLCGMIVPFLGKHIHIVPDFEKAVFLGEVYVAGRISSWVFLINALHLYHDKRLRRFLKKMKREGT